MSTSERVIADIAASLEPKASASGVRPATSPALLETTTMSAVTGTAVDWLWYGRLPLGMLAILDGDPALGKSTISMDIAARVSRGLQFPGDDAPVTAADVALLCAEDSAEHTIRPRLEAAGADLDRCHLIESVSTGDGSRPVTLPHDLPFVERFAAAKGVKLLIIDPLLGYISGEIDSHKDQSIRGVLHEVKLVAERTGCAVLALRHLNKSNGGAALYRGGGSIALTAAARVVLSVGRDPSDAAKRIMAVTKCNLARTPRAIRVRPGDGDGRRG